MILKFENTDIGYKCPLVKDIDLSVGSGELVLLIGNNGVGKTTLFKSILKELPVLKGQISVDGRLIQKLSSSELAKEIAMVFSGSKTPPGYKTSDLIALGKYIHYPYYFSLSSKDHKEVEGIIDSMGLSKYSHLMLDQLSDGNLQKAYIARAVVQDSPIILLDEPTTHLDEANKIGILKLLRSLAHEKGKLIIFSSHDWRLAKEFSDRIWYIKEQTLFEGITEDVLYTQRELTDPVLFSFGKEFSLPKIDAPEKEKELLYSLLQKNAKAVLPQMEFRFREGIWEVTSLNNPQSFGSFQEIRDFLLNTI